MIFWILDWKKYIEVKNKKFLKVLVNHKFDNFEQVYTVSQSNKIFDEWHRFFCFNGEYGRCFLSRWNLKVLKEQGYDEVKWDLIL